MTHYPDQTPAPAVEAYKLALRFHDWTFQYSDDYRVYCKGRDQYAALREMQPNLDPDHAIWNSIAPASCRIKVAA